MPKTFAEMVNPIIRAARVPYRQMGAGAQVPPSGTYPGYNPAGILIIAEICRRLDGKRSFDQIIRQDVYEPAGMVNSWCGMPLAKFRNYTKANRFASTYLNSETDVTKCQPAGGGQSPSRELAFFYEMMLNRGKRNGNQIISPQTVEAMITPKSGIGTMGIWGLGFILAFPENVTGASDEKSRMPRRDENFGPHASPRTFGHPGATGIQAYGDPEHGLAVCHLGRIRGLDGAIYEDLHLV